MSDHHEIFHDEEDLPEIQTPGEKLVADLEGMFSDAEEINSRRALRAGGPVRRAFLRWVRSPVDEAKLTGDTQRLILKPSDSEDTSGYFCELFALYSSEQVEEDGRTITRTQRNGTFYAREFMDGKYRALQFIDSTGVSDAPVVKVPDSFDADVLSEPAQTSPATDVQAEFTKLLRTEEFQARVTACDFVSTID